MSRYDQWTASGYYQDTDAAPSMTTLSHRRYVARQSHTCDCCRKPIAVGDQYWRDVYVQDGEFTVSKRHAKACWDDRATDEDWRLQGEEGSNVDGTADERSGGGRVEGSARP